MTWVWNSDEPPISVFAALRRNAIEIQEVGLAHRVVVARLLQVVIAGVDAGDGHRADVLGRGGAAEPGAGLLDCRPKRQLGRRLGLGREVREQLEQGVQEERQVALDGSRPRSGLSCSESLHDDANRRPREEL